jgi:hypothetical protein
MLSFSLLAGLSVPSAGKMAWVLQLVLGFEERVPSGRAYCRGALVCSNTSSDTQDPIPHRAYWPLPALSTAHSEPDVVSRAIRTWGKPVSGVSRAWIARSEAENRSGPWPQGRKTPERRSSHDMRSAVRGIRRRGVSVTASRAGWVELRGCGSRSVLGWFRAT